MANNVDESVPHCVLEPCWRCVLGSLPFKQWMPESLTQIQDDTCKKYTDSKSICCSYIFNVSWYGCPECLESLKVVSKGEGDG